MIINYLTFVLPPTSSGAGLNHHLGNLYSFLNFAYHNNFRLISPMFLLHGKHNSSKFLKSDLSKYFQFNSVTVEGKSFPITPFSNSIDPNNIKTINIDQKLYNSCGGALSSSDLFCSIPNYSRHIPTSNKLKDMANKIANDIFDKYTCIHARRGDRVSWCNKGTKMRDEELDTATSPTNILKFSRLCGNKKVYIMSDEDPSFFSSLSDSEFDFFFYKDFNILDTQDNFLLYQVEKEIMNLADKKVSTFLVESPKGFYDFNLLNRKGWT